MFLTYFYIISLLPLQAIKSHMRTECKCHGLSGSCTLQTCWKKMPPFRDVGSRLKAKFDGAAKVSGGNNGDNVILPEDSTVKPPSQLDLVYSSDSPDFCVPNKKFGSLGTMNRRCNGSTLTVGGCDILCCGRGYREELLILRESCRCRFNWCCDVKCDTCTVLTTIQRCNGYGWHWFKLNNWYRFIIEKFEYNIVYWMYTHKACETDLHHTYNERAIPSVDWNLREAVKTEPVGQS